MSVDTIKTPLLAVDIVVRVFDEDKFTSRGIVLVERKFEPFGYALPGGFVDVGESTEEAVHRELKEETGLEIVSGTLSLIGVYSSPSRDPRRHVVSAAYHGISVGEPVAGDDADKVKIIKISDLPDLCFDHRKIVDDWLKAMRK